MEDCGVALYCDMHAHSRKHNIFIYGCENLKRHPDRRLLEQVFPLMLHKNVADKVKNRITVYDTLTYFFFFFSFHLKIVNFEFKKRKKAVEELLYGYWV
jgi:hypothetical protein